MIARSLSAAAAISLAGLLAPASAAHAGTWRVDLNLACVHTAPWARQDLNQVNPGAGLEYRVNRTWAVTVGEYENSYRRTSAYALAELTPLHFGDGAGWRVDAGVVAGLLTGYTRLENPVRPWGAGGLFRITAPDGIALDVLGVPNTRRGGSGFIGFQISFPMR